MGFIRSQLQEVGNDLREIKEEMYEIKQAHYKLQQEVAQYVVRGETVFKMVKYSIAVLVALVTLKLGDIKSIWVSIFGR